MAELLPEKWMKAMAVTTTVLGVVASIASSRASFYITKSQLAIAQEADQWSYYQAKSIKEDLFEVRGKSLQYKKLGAVTPAQSNVLATNMQDYAQNLPRYEAEKTEIKKKAESYQEENRICSKRGRQFSLSVVFAQIAIMLSAVGVLLKHRGLWIIGLLFGLISLFFIANGFLLFCRI